MVENRGNTDITTQATKHCSDVCKTDSFASLVLRTGPAKQLKYAFLIMFSNPATVVRYIHLNAVISDLAAPHSYLEPA